jgi:hypothetical protein
MKRINNKMSARPVGSLVGDRDMAKLESTNMAVSGTRLLNACITVVSCSSTTNVKQMMENANLPEFVTPVHALEKR